jgi:uncharacterized RDD family membrane protein YckC
MRWTDDVRLETPEQITVDLELAGLGSRFVAQMVDWLLKILFSGLLVIAVVIAGGLLGFSQQIEHASVLVQALAVAALYLLWLGFDIYYEAVHNGQTPGKRHAGIRVIRDGGAPLDFQAAAVRNLLGLADMLPWFYVLGAVIVLLTPKRQRLGDLAAGTVVVRERTLAAPGETVAAVEQHATDDFAFTTRHLAQCTPNDRHVLRSFLQRLETIRGKERDKLAVRLAGTFAQKTAYELPQPLATGDRATAFLASLFRDLDEHARRG